MLLGKFVKKHINFLKINDLIDLDSILTIEDEILYNWYFYKENNNLIPNNKVSELLKICVFTIASTLSNSAVETSSS